MDNSQKTYRSSFKSRFFISIAGILGIFFIFISIKSLSDLNLDSILMLGVGLTLTYAMIQVWFSRLEISNTGINIINLLKVDKIPWTSIQSINRYPKGYIAFVSARFGIVYGIEITFTQNSSIKKVKLNLNGLSNKEQFLNELSKYAGNLMDETPSEMLSQGRRNFLKTWVIYAVISILFASISVFLFINYSRLINP